MMATRGAAGFTLARRSTSGKAGNVTAKGKLLVFCGKMAAGKSTLSRKLASQEHAVLPVEDEFLQRLLAVFVDRDPQCGCRCER